MPDNIFFLSAYLAFVNVVTFGLFGWDKYCATHDKWRVPEAKLLFWSAIGGSLGAGIAMEFFRHKTLHLKFKFGVPILLFVQIILIGLIITNPNDIVGKLLNKIFS